LKYLKYNTNQTLRFLYPNYNVSNDFQTEATMTINISITNLKGGVGKTTTSGLLAKYLTEIQNRPVILIDLDPQCGTTSLFIGRDSRTSSIKDALVATMEGDDAGEIMRSALVNVPGYQNFFVIPSDKRLTDMISGIPADLLQWSIMAAGFSDDTVVIVDTGTAQGMVGLGICAANQVLVPMMMSKQTVKPTMNTLTMLARFRKPILGVLPVGSGEAQWEQTVLDKYQNTLDTAPDLKPLGGVVLPRIPYSKTLIRGAWASNPFPVNLIPVFDLIYERIFGRSELPVSQIPHPAEVIDG